jgi:hypothetical protein
VPAPDPGAIPWLLLRATSNQGDGVLAQVDFIQRLETRGGVAVPYWARYVFYAG